MNPEKEKALNEAHIQAAIKSKNVSHDAFDAMREKLTTDSEQLSGNQYQSYQPKLRVRTHQTAKTVILEIEDNGPGIPEAMKDKILQPFFTTKIGTEGTGLGLSMSNDIIKAHGGRIKFMSSKGEGSTVSIHLPYLIKQPS